MIAMVNGQLAHIGDAELAGATAANPRVDLERALPIARIASVARLVRIQHESIEAVVVYGLHGQL